MTTADVGVTEAHRKHYLERGWVVVAGVFARREMEERAGEALRCVEAEIASTENHSSYLIDHRRPDGTLAPRKLNRPYQRHESFRRFIDASPMAELVSALMGAPARIATDQIFFKPPGGGPKPYHQDNAYFCCQPEDHVMTAWIAMDDVDEENGCLRYIDGSHRGGILTHEFRHGNTFDQSPDAQYIDLSREALATVGKGGVVFHHGTTLHTSHQNRSDRWRRAWATHWLGPIESSTSAFYASAYFQEAPTEFTGEKS